MRFPVDNDTLDLATPFSLREKCGLCGVTGGEDVLELTHLGLHALQHRGQEAAGMMMGFDDDCWLHADKGLVDEVFSNIPKEWRKKRIERAISHVRYSTAGLPGGKIAQPLMVDLAGQRVGIAHNGTISNARSLRKNLQKEGAIFQTTGDTELMLAMMSQCLIKRH